MTLDSFWYRSHPARWLLWPLGLLYFAITVVRRVLYRYRWLRSVQLPVPVIVVGNITVGGTGKTPLVIWLVEQLRARGWVPGIVSRGYGGNSPHWPREVKADSDPAAVGDEPVLLVQRLNCPVMVGPKRVESAQRLLAGHDVDIIVSDDGLQHYALRRDIEIAVVDGLRGLGNGLPLPAGPLREPVSRLDVVDLLVVNGGAAGDGLRMDLIPEAVVRLDGSESRTLAAFAGKLVHALAGIGHPERFFDSLRHAGVQVLPHAFPDHHRFKAEDMEFPDNLDVVMTEKDAVKCRLFPGPRHWYLVVRASLEPTAGTRLDTVLRRLPEVTTRSGEGHGQETA